MQRRQLFEFEDQFWFPTQLRDFMTDILQYQLAYYEIYRPIFPKLKELLAITEKQRIIDLCAGGGGTLLPFIKEVEKEGLDISILATDMYPNIDAFQHLKTLTDGRIELYPQSVDATSVPYEFDGVRTLFSAFHHFPPDTARKILQDTVTRQCPIALFEFTERISSRIWQMFPGALRVLHDTRHIRPFKWSRLFWTYLIPVMPLIYWWDGLVSQVRTYNVEELEQMVDDIEGESFQWEVGKIQYITYLTGYPKSQSQ
ncbi:MAG: class I SAM-dependent methyltransferase [Candidatus Electrothrix sp. EH2]|nr:class I SAM-dependent methyltransferase [Candidatus Electrothrix sp. EH2]